jgi:hypothetical protein
MGDKPTIRAFMALFALMHALVVRADPPAQPKFDLSSTIVRTLGLRAEYGIAKLGQGGCERELSRIRQAKVASIDGRPVSMGAAATLWFLNGKVGAVPTQGQLRGVDRFFSEGIQAMQPEEYRYIQRDLKELRLALEDRTQVLGTPESRELMDSFKRLESLVGRAKLDAARAEWKATNFPKEYEGAKDLFKTIEDVREHLPNVMRLAAEAESATATSTSAAATISAQAEVVEASAAGALRGSASAEAEAVATREAEAAATRATGQTAARATLGRGMVLGGNIVLGLLALVSIAIHAFDTPEKQAKIYAAQGAKVAEAWKAVPNASDSEVFGANVSTVCTRALKDKAFGQVVSQKMGAVEYWDALQRSINVQKEMQAYRTGTMASVTELPGKRFGASGGLPFDTRLGERTSGEIAL